MFLFFFSKSRGRNNAKYAFQNTFKNNTVHTIRKREEEEKKEQRMDLHDDIRGRTPIQFLTPTDRALPECRYQTKFREGYCEIRISSLKNERVLLRILATDSSVCRDEFAYFFFNAKL